MSQTRYGAPEQQEQQAGVQRHGVGLETLAEVASERGTETVDKILSAARESLGMEVVFAAEFDNGRLSFRGVEGDGESFGFREGEGLPLEGTFCQRVVDGRLPNLVQDARGDERVKDLPVTSESQIGSYIGVPLELSDGEVYGTLCCLSHEADPELRDRDTAFMNVLARILAEQIERERLERERRSRAVKAAGTTALLAALEARDGYTGAHSEAVVALALGAGEKLGLSDEELADLEQAALLHDVGKIGIPDSILRKPGPLDEEEWEMMRQHPAIGESLMAEIEGISHLGPVIRAEHERWDGKGYPDGLAGEEIPLKSRIVFAADAYHAMVSDRPYRKSIGKAAALGELEKNAGTQFCPTTVAAMVDILWEEPPGRRKNAPRQTLAGYAPHARAQVGGEGERNKLGEVTPPVPNPH